MMLPICHPKVLSCSNVALANQQLALPSWARKSISLSCPPPNAMLAWKQPTIFLSNFYGHVVTQSMSFRRAWSTASLARGNGAESREGTCRDYLQHYSRTTILAHRLQPAVDGNLGLR